MKAGRHNAVKRAATVAAGVLLVGLVASGVATAQVRTGAPAPRVAQAVADVMSSLGADGSSNSSDSSNTSSTSPSGRSLLVGAVPAASGSSSTSSTSTGSTSTSSTSTGSTSTGSSTGGLSTNSYVITFPPTPGPTSYGDGHRFYGRYWDSSANCWRYASANYVPQPIVATQIVSVPKGGVNTGDGSFQ